MSLFHRRSHEAEPAPDAVPAPAAAPAPAPPPSPDEMDASRALVALEQRLAEGTLTQAEFEARCAELGL